MPEKKFTANHPLADSLSSMSPAEAINVAKLLCLAAVSRAGAGGCHGGIQPKNINYENGKPVLGPSSSGGRDELTGDELEYVAPERFWSGALTPACDVYSVGLILYTALNGGKMPFVDQDDPEKRTPAERAATLRSRMKGVEFPAPRYAGRELGALIMKACAFQPEDRYATPTDLLLALEALPEGASIPAAVPLVPLTEEQMQAAKSYKVDKAVEADSPKTTIVSRPTTRKTEKADKSSTDKAEEIPLAKDTPKEKATAEKFRKSAPKRSKGAIVLPIVIVLVLAVAVYLLLKDSGSKSTTLSPEASFIVSATDAPEESYVIREPGDATTAEPEATDAPEATPEPTVEPTPEPTEEPAETTYQVFVEDTTWQQAKEKCESLGGHLAMIRSDEDLAKVTELISGYKVKYVWLGAYRSSDGNWYYVDGSPLTYENWDKGEPSRMDTDGTKEDYMMMWKSPTYSTWKFNDMRNDPVSLLPKSFSGKICYVCQFN